MATNSPIPISHKAALESYWRQLELTPHERISTREYTRDWPIVFTGRARILLDAFLSTNGVVSGTCILGFNWTELGIVPVGGQGLTDNERKFCAMAGSAMANLFAEEWANGK